MVFTIHATDGLARCGTLLTRHAQLATPAPLLYTRRGGALYLTPDLLARLSAARRPGGVGQGEGNSSSGGGDASSPSPSSSSLMLGLVTTQFLDQPSPELLTAIVAASASARGGKGEDGRGQGGRDGGDADDDNAAAAAASAAAASSVPGGAGVAWAGLQGWPAFALNRDPLVFEYGPPAGARPGTNDGPHVAVSSGACLASLPAWTRAVRAMAPDCFVGLADELPAGGAGGGGEGRAGDGEAMDADGTVSDGQLDGFEGGVAAAVAAAEEGARAAAAAAAARRKGGGGGGGGSGGGGGGADEPDAQGRVAPPPLPPLPAKPPTKPPRLAFPPCVDPRVARAVERTAWWLDRSLEGLEEAQRGAAAAADAAAAASLASAASASAVGAATGAELSGLKGGVVTAAAARALARKARGRGMPAPFEQQQRGEKAADGHESDDDHQSADAAADDDPTPAPPPLQFFAPVVGCDSPAARLVSAREAARRDGPSVAGYALCGFGTGEPRASRLPLLRAALAPLPPSKPRVCSGLDGGPLEVLDAVAAGVDIFDCAWPTASTGAGYALSFPIEPEEAVEGGPYDEEEADENGNGSDGNKGAAAAATDAPWAAAAPAPVASASAAAASAAAEAAGGPTRGRRLPDGARINLWARGFRLDGRPLAPGCACPACRPAAAAAAAAPLSLSLSGAPEGGAARKCQPGPSRAYLHHLLAVEEMTAEVLLDLHNAHHWLRFFGAVRRAVARGELAEYRASLAGWLERRQY